MKKVAELTLGPETPYEIRRGKQADAGSSLLKPGIHLERLALAWSNGDLIEPNADAEALQMLAQLVADFRTINSRIAEECVPLPVITLRYGVLDPIGERLLVRGVPGSGGSSSQRNPARC